MIFVSFGSHYQDFSRLAKAIDLYALATDEEIIVQFGYTNYRFEHVKSFDFCNRDQMVEYIDNASIIVLQGGWGSISEAIDMGKRIVVVPRINGVEHIHDQVQLVKKLEALECIVAVYDIKYLGEKIHLAKTFHFKNLKRGSATDIINSKLSTWFKL